MSKWKRLSLLIAILAFVQPVEARLNVFACEPEWGALAEELGGEAVSVFSATTARQDPHYIEARPSLIARARRAQLLVCTGADLEAGWLPMVLRQAGNPGIRPGQPGYLEAAEHVPMKGIPARVDRSLGDIHPQGNPHIHLDPRNVELVAAVLSERLAQLDPGQAEHYRSRSDDFRHRWRTAVGQWEAEAGPLRGVSVVVHHESWIYLLEWLGMEQAATLEPKPGIPPTSAHLGRLLSQLEKQPATAIIRAAHQDAKPGNWLAKRTGIPTVELAYTVGGTSEASDLFGLFADTVKRLVAATP